MALVVVVGLVVGCCEQQQLVIVVGCTVNGLADAAAVVIDVGFVVDKVGSVVDVVGCWFCCGYSLGIQHY